MDIRKILDLVLFILFLLLMSFHFLPRDVHEILGVAMTAAVLVHIIINRKRFFSLLKKDFTLRKKFIFVMDAVLIAIFLASLVAGICMSNYLFYDIIPLEFRHSMTFKQLHDVLPYYLIIFVGIHVGLHWRGIRDKFFPFMKKSKKAVPQKILGAIVIYGGVYGSVMDRMGDRLMGLHIFSTAAITEYSFAVYLYFIFSMIGLYAIVGFILGAIFDNIRS